MLEEIQQLKKDLQKVHGHTFYYFQDIDKYVENAVAYTVSGVEQGSQVLLVENTKLFPVIQQKLGEILSKEQLSNVHFKNNFDFYFSKGTFNPAVVFNYFVKSLENHMNPNASIRTWGHIEWGSMQDALQEIVQYENNLNKLINLKNLTSVCAYRADRIPEEFKKALLQCHEFFMTDDEMIKI